MKDRRSGGPGQVTTASWKLFIWVEAGEQETLKVVSLIWGVELPPLAPEPSSVPQY